VIDDEVDTTALAFSSIESAVSALEQVDLRCLVEDPQALAEALIARQYALDHLKSQPCTSVKEDSELRRRLEDVARRDAEAMQLLREAKAHIGELLGNVASGRALARGYGGLSSTDSPAKMGAKRVG
jgi:hypothetical protein